MNFLQNYENPQKFPATKLSCYMVITRSMSVGAPGFLKSLLCRAGHWYVFCVCVSTPRP